VQHQYSRLAARYANAAGIAGAYEIAAAQLFRTQSAWGLTGEIDAQLAQVLPAEVMDRVRDLVRSDAELDAGISADLEQGRNDRIMRTPSVILLVNGERRVIGTGDYSVIKTMLDHFLSRP
jgi:protein-disulfide isomerase